MAPNVSVVCVCYQHARFIREALQSVADQTYPAIELIVVDDGSTDGSATVIREWADQHPAVKIILNPHNLGYCTAFNLGWRMATGDYVIDLAGDDMLLPDRVTKGVAAFSVLSSPGIQFTDAMYVDETGHPLSRHSDRFPHATVPQGFIFRDVLRRYFICSPTMMISREVLAELRGYDETLSYEDFDLWVRAARSFPFHYLPEVLVHKRIVPDSLAVRQLSGEARHNMTTFRVCEKARALAATSEERKAVRYRVFYEACQSGKRWQFPWVAKFGALWVRMLFTG